MSIFNKFERVYELFEKDGFSGVKKQIIAYVYNHIKEKWRFTYFELDLTKKPYSLPDIDKSTLIRRAKPADIGQIRTDLYPYMEDGQEYDKKHMECVGGGNIECFLTEKEGKLVSYFVVFKEANRSPLMKTPFQKGLLKESDAYLSSTFTVPSARGMWIVPHLLLSIIDYLQKESQATRAILLVHEDTPGAIGFYKRLGFKVIDNAVQKGFFLRTIC